MAMAIMNWNVQRDGNDDNGGGFKQGGSGTDRSLSATPYVTLDGTTIKATAAGASANMTITGHTAAAADVGNIVHVTGGTNATAGWYEIQSISGADWVVDRNWCTGAVTDGSGRMGGALASVGGLGALLASNSACRILYSRGWVKYSATQYDLGSASYNVAGGAFQHDGGWNFPFALIGYYATQGDFPTAAQRPRIDAGSYNPSTGVIYSNEATEDYSLLVANIIVDGNATAAVGFGTNAAHHVYFCQSVDCPRGFVGGHCWVCEAVNSSTAGFEGYTCIAYKCVANTCVIGFNIIRGAIKCLAFAGAGVGFLRPRFAVDCAVASKTGAGSDGFDNTTTSGVLYLNCVATGNAGYGFDLNGGMQAAIGCYTDANTGGTSDVTGVNFYGSVTELAASPWAAATSYWLNNDNPGGAELRKIGVKLPLTDVVDEPDIGPTQHADPAGGGGGGARIIGG